MWVLCVFLDSSSRQRSAPIRSAGAGSSPDELPAAKHLRLQPPPVQRSPRPETAAAKGAALPPWPRPCEKGRASEAVEAERLRLRQALKPDRRASMLQCCVRKRQRSDLTKRTKPLADWLNLQQPVPVSPRLILSSFSA